MTRLQVAINQIIFARTYTLRLLDSIPLDEWFRQPSEGVTHIAWQVGHLAMAEFHLLRRVWGDRPGDHELISESFLSTFDRASVPDPDPSKYPAVAKIRAVFDQVHARALEDLARVQDVGLDEPVTRPHAIVKTKFDAIVWCGQHELVHAGQIGLLRRLLGYPPLW